MILNINISRFLRLYPEQATHFQNVIPKTLDKISIDWFEKLDLKDIHDVIIYGVGLGEAYVVLNKWLKEDHKRRLIILEENIEITKHLLETDMGLQIMTDEQVEFLFFERKSAAMMLNRLMWQSFDRNRLILKDPRINPELFKTLLNALNHDADRMKYVGREYSFFGLGYYLNYYQNLTSLSQSFDGSDLIGQAKNIPAVIVGAGPSLNVNGHLLKKLKNKALIMAGGSALLSLKALNLKPHFGGGIDPNLSQLDRLSRYGKYDFPFIYTSRVHAAALKLIESPKIYIATTGGFKTENWLNDQLGIPNVAFKEGASVFNFLTEVAVKMGCNPIIYVGHDLAYTNNSLYSQGVIEDNQILDDKIPTNDINNNPTYTQWAWIREADWTASYAHQHPETTFINATEGGIGIKNIPNQTLKKVIKERLAKTYDFKNLFKFKPLKIDHNEILDQVSKLYISLKKLDHLLNDLKLKIEQIDLFNPKIEDFLESEEWLNQFKDEIAYQAILEPFCEYIYHLTTNSHTAYLVNRDGINSKNAKQLASLHLQKISYLKEVIASQLTLLVSHVIVLSAKKVD